MKRNKKRLVIGIAALSLFLSGCGTSMFELTADEEAIIIQSAAYLIAKHNIQQKDGISNVFIEEETETELPTESESELPTESESEENKPSGDGNDGDNTVQGTLSLAAAIGHASDLKITYEGHYLSASYVEKGAFSVDAEPGNTFYVMKFKMTNTTNGDVVVNNAKLNPIFRIKSGEITAKSAVSFMTTDLSTYTDTISAGKTVEVVLLFELPKEKAEAVKNPTLQITIGKESKIVKL